MGSHQESIDRILEALSLFFPESKPELKIKPAGSNPEDGFDVFLNYPNSGGKDIPLDDLSSGEIELFSFLSAVLRKNLENGILIIDEPELHLHISWHRVILAALRKLLPHTQIICATHSLEIVESVMSYELFILKTDEDYGMRNG